MKKNDLTNNGSKRKPSLLTRLLWWCAGVDSELIKKCPHEWAKYASMGATILFTGVFASIAGGYALYTVFRNGSLSSIDNNAIMYAMIFGLFWGLVIFNLDRYIITTFKKSDSKSGIINICKDTFHALPRILLAIIIAITISKPIELKLFENRLAQQIKQSEQETQKKNGQVYNGIYRIDEITGNIANIDSNINDYNGLLDKKPQEVEELEILKRNYENNKKQLEKDWKNADSNCKKIFGNNNNFVTKHDASGLPYVERKYQFLKPQAKNKYDKFYSVRANKKMEIQKIKKSIENTDYKISMAWTEYRNNLKGKIKDAEEEKRKWKGKKDTADANIKKATDDANAVAKIAYTNNFVTQLEALSCLKRANLEGLDPEKDKEEIEKRKAEAHSFYMISLAITLLFLCIELSPMLTKLITSRGTYDELLEAEEYRQKSICRLQIEKLRQDYEVEVKTYNEEKKNHYEVTVESNKKIMEQIASVQAELLETAIEEWRVVELDKIKRDPSQYIQSNTRKE